MNETQPSRIKPRYVAIGAWILFALTYATLFAAFAEAGVVSAVQRALINVVPAALLSFAVFKVIESYIVGKSLIWQFLLHFALALAFCILWYVGIQVGYGLQDGWVRGGIIGQPLIGIALTWQALQGVTLYSAIAGFTYASIFHDQLRQAQSRIEALALEKSQISRSRKGSRPKQIMVKDGSSLKPVPIADILLLSGAGDYTEVITRDGTHLSSTSLSEFEAELSDSEFARIHRSHIVRMDEILSVESAGNGRLTLHLPKGVSVTTSRAGARIVRESAL